MQLCSFRVGKGFFYALPRTTTYVAPPREISENNPTGTTPRCGLWPPDCHEGTRERGNEGCAKAAPDCDIQRHVCCACSNRFSSHILFCTVQVVNLYSLNLAFSLVYQPVCGYISRRPIATKNVMLP